MHRERVSRSLAQLPPALSLLAPCESALRVGGDFRSSSKAEVLSRWGFRSCQAGRSRRDWLSRWARADRHRVGMHGSPCRGRSSPGRCLGQNNLRRPRGRNRRSRKVGALVRGAGCALSHRTMSDPRRNDLAPLPGRRQGKADTSRRSARRTRRWGFFSFQREREPLGCHLQHARHSRLRAGRGCAAQKRSRRTGASIDAARLISSPASRPAVMTSVAVPCRILLRRQQRRHHRGAGRAGR
jgi:hypothetical protein